MADLHAVDHIVDDDLHQGVQVALTLIMGDDSLFGTIERKTFTLGTRTDLSDLVKTKHHIL
jgi:hypothetical protein